MSRRRFLAGAGAWRRARRCPDVLFARTGGAARLVVVVLRGALDGLGRRAAPRRSVITANLHR